MQITFSNIFAIKINENEQIINNKIRNPGKGLRRAYLIYYSTA